MKELQEKNTHELQQLLQTSRDALRTMRFKVATRELKNVRELRITRKTVAQIITLLNAKRS